MTDIGRRRFVQGALGTTAFLALPGRLVASPRGAAAGGVLPDRYPPIIEGFPHMLHGGDWNPDQWLHEPGVLEQDFALMEKAGCNTFSIGIFAWATLEPEEGRFELGWLDEVMNGLAKRGFHAFLATPSGAKPRWMSEKYEEVRRIDAQGRRELHGSRHNHCFTSPVYREKVRIVNTRLAERYKGHPALGGWHISNEYSGACYCNYCLAAFRAWLKTRYADLDALNQAYWAAFWAQKFQTWEQIDPRECADGRAPARLGPLRHPPDGGFHEERGRPAEGGDTRSPGHHQHDDVLRRARLLAFRRGLRPHGVGRLPAAVWRLARRGGGPLDGARLLPDDEGRAALPAHGVDALEHELAADAAPQAARPAPPGDAPRDRPRRRRHDVLPVAQEPGRLREDARRGRRPRGH